MGGFKNSSLNSGLKLGLYETLIDFLIKSSELMRNNYTSDNRKIINHEEKVTVHLTENYLNNSNVRSKLGILGTTFKFIIESMENYNIDTDTYKGRTDIKVVSMNWLTCTNNQDYYIIECKRLDGTTNLNQKYITKGICRFVTPPVKYLSYHNKNIMFGFIVNALNINDNIIKITRLHEENFAMISNENLSIIRECESGSYCLCESSYHNTTNKLLLSHLFYDFSSIIESKEVKN